MEAPLSSLEEPCAPVNFLSSILGSVCVCVGGSHLENGGVGRVARDRRDGVEETGWEGESMGDLSRESSESEVSLPRDLKTFQIGKCSL